MGKPQLWKPETMAPLRRLIYPMFFRAWRVAVTTDGRYLAKRYNAQKDKWETRKATAAEKANAEWFYSLK